jgi:hypothetical protein
MAGDDVVSVAKLTRFLVRMSREATFAAAAHALCKTLGDDELRAALYDPLFRELSP